MPSKKNSLTLHPLSEDARGFQRGAHGLTATSLSGSVHLHLRDAKTIPMVQTVFVRLVGYARLTPSSSPSSPSSPLGHKQLLVDVRVPLYQAAEGVKPLGAGTHILPFDLPVPSDLPDTQMSPDGSVQYSLIGVCRGGTFTQRTQEGEEDEEGQGEGEGGEEIVRSEPVTIPLIRAVSAVAELDDTLTIPTIWEGEATTALPDGIRMIFPSRAQVFSPMEQISVTIQIPSPSSKVRVGTWTLSLHQLSLFRYPPPRDRPLIRREVLGSFNGEGVDGETPVVSPEQQGNYVQDAGVLAPGTQYLTLTLSVPRTPELVGTGDAGLIGVAHRLRLRLDINDPEGNRVLETVRVAQPCILTLITPRYRGELAGSCTRLEETLAIRALANLRAWNRRAVRLSPSRQVPFKDPSWVRIKEAGEEGEEGGEEGWGEEAEGQDMWTTKPCPFPLPPVLPWVDPPTTSPGSDAQLKAFLIEPLPGRSTLVKGYHGLTVARAVGRVRLDVAPGDPGRREVRASRLELYLYGTERLAGEATASSRSGDRKLILSRIQELWTATPEGEEEKEGEGKRTEVWGAGEREFRFDIPLEPSTTLPESTVLPEGAGGIRYMLTAELVHFTPEGREERRCTEAEVDLVRAQLTGTPVGLGARVWGSDRREEGIRGIRWLITLPCRVFGPGDEVQVVVKGESTRTGVEVRSVRVELVEWTRLMYQRPRVLNRLVGEAERSFGQGSREEEVSLGFVRRPDVRASLQARLMRIHHEIRIRIQVSGERDVEVSCPVVCTSVRSDLGQRVRGCVRGEEVEEADKYLAWMLEDGVEEYGKGKEEAELSGMPSVGEGGEHEALGASSSQEMPSAPIDEQAGRVNREMGEAGSSSPTGAPDTTRTMTQGSVRPLSPPKDKERGGTGEGSRNEKGNQGPRGPIPLPPHPLPPPPKELPQPIQMPSPPHETVEEGPVGQVIQEARPLQVVDSRGGSGEGEFATIPLEVEEEDGKRMAVI
ncbi:MAG: hypothetical protein DHS80DRAFT_31942 [Piptocephalis tieghemiana]|nr:MAG: hypothetical protein DHS80DRAFT_31942 [Piptocephalis tieghemiana]